MRQQLPIPVRRPATRPTPVVPTLIPSEALPEVPHLVREGRLAPGEARAFTAFFLDGESAEVRAYGNGDIDLYIFDRFGALVAHDNADGETPRCAWTPRGTGECLIKLVNSAGHPVDFTLKAL